MRYREKGLTLKSIYIKTKNYYVDKPLDLKGDTLVLPRVSKDGDGIATSMLTIDRHCIDGKILKCKSTSNRRQGMNIEGAVGLEVFNCRFDSTSSPYLNSRVEIEPYNNLNTVSNVTFKDCEFNNNENSRLFLYGDNIRNVEVENCNFINNNGYSINIHADCISLIRCNIKNKSNLSVHLAGTRRIRISNSPICNILCESLSDRIVSNNIIFSDCIVSKHSKNKRLVTFKRSSLSNNLQYYDCIIDGKKYSYRKYYY